MTLYNASWCFMMPYDALFKTLLWQTNKQMDNANPIVALHVKNLILVNKESIYLVDKTEIDFLNFLDCYRVSHQK